VNVTYLRMEIIRLLRNRRVLIFSILMPAILLGVIGGLYKQDSLNGANVAAYIMVSMGLFGSMSGAIGSGGTIALERGIGWNRQLRLTPLAPGQYLLTKVVLSMIMALPPLLVTYAVGAISLGVRLPAQTWISIGVASWLGALPFAALGLVIGYVAKPDSVQQVSALLYMLLALFGGIWVPAEQMPNLMRHIAEWTPAYWVGQVARSPLFHQSMNMHAIAILAAWTAGFGLLAMRRFRADTARA
jgi:ABC-2 type transport system permease protein